MTELASKTNFIKDNLEKVLRLSEILRLLNSDSFFQGKLALKGGTAINLTSVELPSLSVDIDLDFTKNLVKEQIEEAKIEISKKTNGLHVAGWVFLECGVQKPLCPAFFHVRIYE